jgi:hypothetical protein
MSNWLSFVISCLALGISGLTAWLTFFRKGTLKMTQPTMVYFGPDGNNLDDSKNKIYLRTLLYCSAKKGYVLESLYLSVQRNETKQNFNFWVYGQKGQLSRGSGLFVPQDGVTFDHHFLPPKDGTEYLFLPGLYTITVFANAVNQITATKLMSLQLAVSDAHAEVLKNTNAGLFFDWGPDQQKYHAYIRNRPDDSVDFEKILQIFDGKQRQFPSKN